MEWAAFQTGEALIIVSVPRERMVSFLSFNFPDVLSPHSSAFLDPISIPYRTLIALFLYFVPKCFSSHFSFLSFQILCLLALPTLTPSTHEDR